MFDRVVQRLQRHPVQVLLGARIDHRSLGRSVHRDGQSGAGTDRSGLFPQGGDQAFLSQRSGAQLEDQRAHLGERALGESADPVHLHAGGFTGVDAGRRQVPLGGAGVQGHGEQGLADRVVQLTGQPLPFQQGRVLLGRAEQVGVLRGDRGLVGQRGQESLVIGGELGAGRQVDVQLAEAAALGTERDHHDVVPSGVDPQRAHAGEPFLGKRFRAESAHHRDRGQGIRGRVTGVHCGPGLP